jgi:hypothetical protein
VLTQWPASARARNVSTEPREYSPVLFNYYAQRVCDKLLQLALRRVEKPLTSIPALGGGKGAGLAGLARDSPGRAGVDTFLDHGETVRVTSFHIADSKP